MIKIDHPIIRKMERDGFLELDEPIGYDYFGRPYYQDDEFYVYDGERFLVRELSQDTIEIFEYLGAKKVCATNTDK